MLTNNINAAQYKFDVNLHNSLSLLRIFNINRVYQCLVPIIIQSSLFLELFPLF